MKLRSGKKYQIKSLWWYKYTIEACRGRNMYEKEDFSLFDYNKYTVKEWMKKILPLYELNIKNKQCEI